MKKSKVIYLIGALQNDNIPFFANEIEALGFECFSDWFAPGRYTDSFLRKYAKTRGWNYKQTLNSYAARNIFEFDHFHLSRADLGVALFPIGRSGHLESGFLRGQNKPVYALFDKEPVRFDIMNLFFTDVFLNKQELFERLKNEL